MEKPKTNSFLLVGIFISVLAVLANLLFFAITQALGEQYLIPITETSKEAIAMPTVMILIATLFPAILASLLYISLYKKNSKTSIQSFLAISLTALLISFGGPMDLPGAGIRTKLFLSGMHLMAAAIIIGGLLINHMVNAKSTEKEGN